MNRALRILFTGGLAVLCVYFLIRYSLYLAAMRIYQVDECQNVFVASILSAGRAGEAYSTLSLFHAPLVWLAHDATQSSDLFASARLIALLIFWLNLLLIAVAAGERLLSRRTLIALIGATTLAPLWDYGFEIRHDNLLLTGLLLTWCVLRLGQVRLHSYVIVGVLAAAMQFTAFKAFVYTGPLAVALLVFPPSGKSIPRWRIALGWLGGALCILLFFRIAYGAAGVWELCLSDFLRVATDATGDNRFSPWNTFGRLLTQTPMLLALVASGLLALGLDCRKRGRTAVTWKGPLPEALAFLVALAALVINPTPFAYNLVNLVPFAFLFAFRHAAELTRDLWVHASYRTAVIPVVIFAHLVPFAIATRRHLDWPNFRQESRMQLAEDLTDAKNDPVYDGIGLVPTRRSVGFHWFLHSFNIQSFRTGPGPFVRDMLATNPAAVIITSYRTDWLPEQDHAFIRSNYVTLADDFWVLGKVLPVGGGTFEIIHPGRYRISTLAGSDLAGTYPEGLKGMMTPEEPGKFEGSLDGAPIPDHPIELTVGTHRIEAASNCQPAVVWVGPRRNRPHRLPPGDHRSLFVNWY